MPILFYFIFLNKPFIQYAINASTSILKKQFGLPSLSEVLV